jgi:hypothetical protein
LSPYGCDCRWGMDWILDLLAQLRITSNHSAIADFHTSRITTAPAKPFLACCVFTSCSLELDPNRVLWSRPYSLAKVSQLHCHVNYSAISSQPPLQSSTQVTSQLNYSTISSQTLLQSSTDWLACSHPYNSSVQTT